MTVQSAIISLIGAIISGIMATIITLYVNHTTEIKRNKKELAAEIFGYRFLINRGSINAEKFYIALNKVPIIFQDDKNVLSTYEELFIASLTSDPRLRVF